MSNDNALFEDDFDTDFEDFIEEEFAANNDLVADDEILEEVFDDVGATEVVAPITAPMKDLTPVDAMFDLPQEGGDRIIPAISINAFCERADTQQMLETAASDRRMSRTVVDFRGGSLPAAIEFLSSNPTPNLLIVESSLPASEMIPMIDELAQHCDENVKVLVIGATNDIALYRQLMARGVSEYLVPPLQPLKLIRSVSELFIDPDAPFVGKSISVVGAKGGVGSSTIAHNLAWSITENIGVAAAMVDLDLSFGTTALDFNAESAQSVADALMAPDRTDEAVIERLLHKVTDRLSLFTAPSTVGQIMDIPAESFATVIDNVRRSVPHVILDLPHAWSDWVQQTLVGSDEVILVCQPDLASLRNGKNILDQMKSQRPNDVPPRLVLNMAGVPNRPEIPVKDFAAAIGAEPEVILPFEPKLFGTAANNGQMIAETDAGSKSSLAIDHLASLMTGRTVQVEQKSFIKKLLKK